MPIIKHQSQNKTLYEFYSRMIESDEIASQEVGQSMLHLIDDLNKRLVDVNLFSFTSLHHTVLATDNAEKANTFVKFISNGNEFRLNTNIGLDNSESDIVFNDYNLFLDRLVNIIHSSTF